MADEIIIKIPNVVSCCRRSATKLVLRLTHRLWFDAIAGVIARAYSEGKITDKQLNELSSLFNPANEHDVY